MRGVIAGRRHCAADGVDGISGGDPDFGGEPGGEYEIVAGVGGGAVAGPFGVGRVGKGWSWRVLFGGFGEAPGTLRCKSDSSAEGAERGGGPGYADSVRNEVFCFCSPILFVV